MSFDGRKSISERLWKLYDCKRLPVDANLLPPCPKLLQRLKAAGDALKASGGHALYPGVKL